MVHFFKTVTFLNYARNPTTPLCNTRAVRYFPQRRSRSIMSFISTHSAVYLKTCHNIGPSSISAGVFHPVPNISHLTWHYSELSGPHCDIFEGLGPQRVVQQESVCCETLTADLSLHRNVSTRDTRVVTDVIGFLVAAETIMCGEEQTNMDALPV